MRTRKANRGAVVKSAVLVVAGVVALVAMPGAAYAQDPPVMQPPAAQPAPAPPVPVQPPTAQTPGEQTAPAAAATPPSLESRRDELRVMEMALIQAVQKGAQELARQLKVSDPGSAFVMGTGRARGFVLEGYGLFFDVDVPEMRQSVVWSMQMVELMNQRANAEQFLRNSTPDDPRRAMAGEQIRRIDRMMAAAAQGTLSLPAPTQNMQLAAPERGIIGAQNVADGTVAPPGSALTASPAPPVPPTAVAAGDPNALYTSAVKNALIDSMLLFSSALRIADNEWLTVAASDSTGPPIPGGLDDSSRIVIRIKGADLAAFKAGKLTRPEMLKKVEVREF